MVQSKNLLLLLGSLSCFGSLASAVALPKIDSASLDTRAPEDNMSTMTDTQRANKKEYDDFFAAQRKDMNIVKTTTQPDGTIIDWIPMDSQAGGKIAKPPPAPQLPPQWNKRKTVVPTPQLEMPGAERGPEGTVPVLRQDTSRLNYNQSLAQYMNKAPPVDRQHPPAHMVSSLASAQAQPHWYASSSQAVNNRGGAASLSLFRAWTESNNDFSLLQTAVIKYNVPKNGQSLMQTVEAGWINFPAQVGPPHLFTYFTTDGYQSTANNAGGWNRDVQGWVQIDNTIFPGSSFSPLSTSGGAQYELPIRYYLFQGNWWLQVTDRYIGYYPSSLFAAGTSNAAASLQNGADHINWYGEIFQSGGSTTRTDMGSGEWPETGFGRSGYIRNMVYIDTNNADQAYDGSAGMVVSDTSRYRIAPTWRSGTNWGSYFFLGGPGAGGQIGN